MPSRFPFNPLLWSGWYCALFMLLLGWVLLTASAWLARCADSLALCSHGPQAIDGVLLNWSQAVVLTLGLSLVWCLAFGARWGWLYYKKLQQKERAYDFPADEFDQLMQGWKSLSRRQLGWWLGGLAWWLVHLAVLLLQLKLGVWLLAVADLLGLVAAVCLLASRDKQLEYSLLVTRHKVILLAGCAVGWVLALGWLLLEFILLAQGAMCNQALDCYTAYPLLITDARDNWQVAANLAVLGLQLGLWLLLCVHYLFLPRMGIAWRAVGNRVIYTLQSGLPVLWLLGVFAPMQFRLPFSMALALVGVLLLGLMVRYARAQPMDSLTQRLQTSADLRHWVRADSLRY